MTRSSDSRRGAARSRRSATMKVSMQRTRRTGNSAVRTKRVGAIVTSALLALVAVVAASGPAQAASAVKISRVYYDSPGSDTRSTISLNAEYVNLQNMT